METLCFTPYVKIPKNDVVLHNATTTRRRKLSVFATVSKPKPQIDTEVLKVAEQRLRVSPTSFQYESGRLGAVPDHKVEEGGGRLSEMEYLTNILSSNRVYDVAIESPLSLAPKLSERLGVNVWLKREDLQPVRELCLVTHFHLNLFLLDTICYYSYLNDVMSVYNQENVIK
ncbi:putative threonine ammonia-lyase [Helianthus debilis subsp. tardiflorus]